MFKADECLNNICSVESSISSCLSGCFQLGSERHGHITELWHVHQARSHWPNWTSDQGSFKNTLASPNRAETKPDLLTIRGPKPRLHKLSAYIKLPSRLYMVYHHVSLFPEQIWHVIIKPVPPKKPVPPFSSSHPHPTLLLHPFLLPSLLIFHL